jgi:hypothetical protein
MVLIKSENKGQLAPKPGTYIAFIQKCELVTELTYDHRGLRATLGEKYAAAREKNEDLYWEDFMQTLDPSTTEKKIRFVFAIVKDMATRENAISNEGEVIEPLACTVWTTLYPNHRSFKGGKSLSLLGEILEAGGMDKEKLLESKEVDTDNVLGEIVTISTDIKTSAKGTEYAVVKKSGVVAYGGNKDEVTKWIVEAQGAEGTAAAEPAAKTEEKVDGKAVEDLPWEGAGEEPTAKKK